MKLFGKQNLEIQIEGLQKKLDGLESQLAKAKLEHQKHEASAAKALADAAKENERLVLALKQTQEEFNQLGLDKKQVEASLAKAKDEAGAQAKHVIELKQDLALAHQHTAKEQKAKQAAESALTEIKAQSTAELKAVTDKYTKQAQVAKTLEAELAQRKAELEETQQTLVASKAETSHAQQAKLEIDTLQVRTLAELEQLKKEAAQQVQLHAAKLKEADNENELLLNQLMTVQEELEKIFLDKKQLEMSLAEATAKAKDDALAALEQQHQSTKKFDADIAQLKTTLNQAQQAKEHDVAKQKAELAVAIVEMTQLKQDLAQAIQKIAEEQSAKQAAESALSEIKAKSPAQLKAVTDKYQQQAQATLALEAELAKQKSEHEDTKAKTAKLDQDLAQAQQNIAKEQSDKKAVEAALADIKLKALAEIKALTEKYQQLAEQQANKLKDTAQENELLLTQLMQVQEELESYYLDKTKFEQLYQDILARWTRLEKRYPNYADYGSLELVTFDNLSDVPSITWRVKNYAQGGLAFDEFLFQTVLQDGQPGIALVHDAKQTATPDSALVPKLLKPQSKQLERFVRMGQTEFRQLRAAANIFTQLEASGWRAVDLPQKFDLGFWRPSLKLLPTQMQALPMLLRYDAVKLKRELINPDYEHLWLEFNGMGLGPRTWPKFEMRLGAAMVQRDGFSEFPKFEFPLIDGKTKPFDSWYAESQDDNGAKLELRFALEKKVFDTSVWGKLEDADKALLLRLIYVMPDVLLRLEAESTSIHRPWATWVGFAKEAMQVIEASRAAAQPKQLPAPTPQVTPQVANTAPVLAPPAQLPAPTVQKSSPNKVQSKKISPKKVAAKKLATKKVPVIKHSTNNSVAPKPTAKTKPAAKKAVGKPATAKKTAARPKPAPAKKITASKPMVKQPMVKRPAIKATVTTKRSTVKPAAKKQAVRKK